MKRAAENLAGVSRVVRGPVIEYGPPGTHSPILDLLACYAEQMGRSKGVHLPGSEDEEEEDPCDPGKIAGSV